MKKKIFDKKHTPLCSVQCKWPNMTTIIYNRSVNICSPLYWLVLKGDKIHSLSDLLYILVQRMAHLIIIFNHIGKGRRVKNSAHQIALISNYLKCNHLFNIFFDKLVVYETQSYCVDIYWNIFIGLVSYLLAIY